jgi:hypothetical protein
MMEFLLILYFHLRHLNLIFHLFLIDPIYQYHEIDHQFYYNMMLTNHMYLNDLFLNIIHINHQLLIIIINMLMEILNYSTMIIILNIFKQKKKDIFNEKNKLPNNKLINIKFNVT